MYRIAKKLEVAGAHCLDLPYASKCTNVHGHNWIIEILLGSEVLNDQGMVMDFAKISKIVMALDHQNINTIIEGNPTAERIAAWIYQQILDAEDTHHIVEISVVVQESKGNIACYENI